MGGASIGAFAGPVGIITGAIAGGLIVGLSTYYGCKKVGEEY